MCTIPPNNKKAKISLPQQEVSFDLSLKLPEGGGLSLS
jgi:hypothetical protein